MKTPFAGWIRKVYADATGNFIGKGEPLFTVSSPDLVATEQAYLLAKKNSESLQRSSAQWSGPLGSLSCPWIMAFGG